MKRVLIVDDDMANRIILFSILKNDINLDLEIDMAEEGLSALKVLTKKKYDLVITDYKMPKMDGLELTKTIKMMFPETIVILRSADSEVENNSKMVGADLFLEKSCDLENFKNIVISLLSY